MTLFNKIATLRINSSSSFVWWENTFFYCKHCVILYILSIGTSFIARYQDCSVYYTLYSLTYMCTQTFVSALLQLKHINYSYINVNHNKNTYNTPLNKTPFCSQMPWYCRCFDLWTLYRWHDKWPRASHDRATLQERHCGIGLWQWATHPGLHQR